MTNNLAGVLLRFRLGKIAVTSDIEKMFYSIKVSEADSNFLRFFWYTDNNLNLEPVQFRLTVHVFGAKSSPSCANFALKQCIDKDESEGDAGCPGIFESFYVDDLMLATDSEDNAISLVNQAQSVLSNNGFNLTGFASNSRNVTKSYSA